jgi:hypothetical protein
MDNNIEPPPTLTLVDIAKWQFPDLLPDLPKPPIIAAIPSLQRQAVWKPGQIEMVWDSILRGFPIGALVVSEKFAGQASRSGRHGSGWPEEEVTHFLLDGQQRCNAIALAFKDAFAVSTDGEQPPATLWVDLNPDPLPDYATRRFVLRVLTTSHPWGYGLDDAASPLGLADIKNSLKHHDDKRPLVTKSWPQKANCPVPFSWLIQHTFDGEGPIWEAITEKCSSLGEIKWAKASATYLREPASAESLRRIEAALHKLKAYRLVPLQVPDDVIHQVPTEPKGNAHSAENDVRIDNVEHLFQRLNSAGTELRGEELLYCLIKAYWPGIEESFEQIRDERGRTWLPMPASRLAILGIRAALIENKLGTAFSATSSIAEVRKLGGASHEDETAEAVRRYLGIGSNPQNSDLHLNLKRIDQWLLYKGREDFGLPPVLRSNLARGAPDVFLLLLHLAQKTRQDDFPLVRKPLIALATAIHWFGVDQKKAVQALLPKLQDQPLTEESFRGILRPLVESSSLLQLQQPFELKALPLFVSATTPDLPKWCVEHQFNLEKTPQPTRWFFDRLRWCRPILIFAQRHYMTEQFGEYDPSCTDVWKDHNRPWDYDHILSSATLKGNQQAHREACRQWVNTIGNLRAWRLELNRGRHDQVANGSIFHGDYEASFIENQAECDSFSLTWGDVADANKSAAFMNAAFGRLHRIYKEWFNQLDVGFLLDSPPTSSPTSRDPR